MRTGLNSVALETLGVLRASGADVVSFLQGQLSNDLALLSPERSLLAGYHNPQGRVIALLRLMQAAPGEVLAVLPRELAAAVTSRLARYILRAKAKVTDESPGWRVVGLFAAGEAEGAATPSADALPQALHAVARVDGSIAVRVAAEPARWLLVSPVSAVLPRHTAAPPDTWQRLSVAAGEPEVLKATSEEFVAQMLNLDALGAIDFDKGCYTGQEIIARAHYRGRVKRRMQRFLTDAPMMLEPGASGVFADGRTFRVVRTAPHPDGRCEFLAVTALAAVAGPPGAEGAEGAAATAAPLRAQRLELPYSLPD